MARSIVYDEDIINEVNKRLVRLGEKSNDCNTKMTSNYAGYTSHGILSEPLNDLNKNFNSFESVVSSTANSFLKHGSEMIDFDRKAALEIDNVNIPQDFVGNNSMEINYYNASILSKVDGKSVNNGEKTTEESKLDDSTVIASEELFDINKRKDTDKKEYDETTVIGKSILGSLDGGETTQKEFDDSTTVGNIKLKNINEGQTEEKKYNDAVSINNVGLNSLNGGTTVKQDFDDSTVIGESILGSVNSNNKEPEQIDVDKIMEERMAKIRKEAGLDEEEEIIREELKKMEENNRETEKVE